MRNSFLAVRVIFLLLRVEWFLRRLDLAATCRRLGVVFREPGGTATDLPTERVNLLYHHARAVDVLIARWPGGDTCLRRCLVLGTLSRDLSPHLVLGVKKGAAGFEAHSWLQIDGVSLDPSSADWIPLEIS